MAKYDLLHTYLKRRQDPEVRLSFREIERIISSATVLSTYCCCAIGFGVSNSMLIFHLHLYDRQADQHGKSASVTHPHFDRIFTNVTIAA